MPLISDILLFSLFCVPMVALFACKTAWLLTRILVFNVFLLQKKRMQQIPSLLINRINPCHKYKTVKSKTTPHWIWKLQQSYEVSQTKLSVTWTVIGLCLCQPLKVNEPLITFFGVQVNNATARVMTNKKMTTPYSNGEGLAALPYGNAFCTVGPERWGRNYCHQIKAANTTPTPSPKKQTTCRNE